MHQQARPPPGLASPASSPQTYQTRPSSHRDAVLATSQRTGSNVPGRDLMSSPTAEQASSTGPPAETIKKLDQIVQNFYAKAAILVLDARMKVKITRNSNGLRKTNKWYQIETDEIDDFRDELKIWKTCGSLDHCPPPLVIEVYLDTSRLKENQSLVILDDEGKRWDVMEQLNTSGSSSGSDSPNHLAKNAEVILERWRIDMKTTLDDAGPVDDFGPILPTVYKKAIVFFRTLFVTTRLLPAWKFASLGAAKSSHPALIPRCRIRTSEPSRSSPDLLRQSIGGRTDAVTEYMFGDLDLPVGRLSASVVYRTDCSFRIDDFESLLSSRFMGVDENFFKPSLPSYEEGQRAPITEVGSLRGHRRGAGPSDVRQTYGSLSTFHGEGPVGTSPISALKAVRPPGSDSSSPPASFPSTGIACPNSLPVSGRPSSSRVPARPADLSARRTSVPFQPFKAGSLSGSPIPRPFDPESPASTHSLNRPVGFPAGSQPRNRSSLTAGMPASLRGGPPPGTPDAPAAGSPRPASARYSSSFSHRRGRPSGSGASKGGDEEQSSSGRQSLASSVAQPGSGFLAEPGPASSGSLHAEEDDISDFLKVLDSKKTLKSLEPAKKGESATNRTIAQLSKFHLMRDSNNALGDSMTSSMQMHRSSSSSSRQLTSVPGMVAPASVSTSTSPGKPASPHTPHTPHTPAIPSRLSENSIIDYSTTGRNVSRGGRRQTSTVPEPSRESTITQEGTTAIDIPLSPRLGSYQRRSSSVAQQTRTVVDEDDTDLAFAAHRSISLGADDREPPTMSTLLGRQMQMDRRPSARESPRGSLRPAAEIQASGSAEAMQRESSEGNPLDGLIPSAQSSSPFPRRRYTGMAAAAAAARPTPPQSSRGSFTGSVSRLGRADDESVSGEPLMFDLSEMDAHGRRSLEETRGAGNANTERSGFEPRGTTRRGW